MRRTLTDAVARSLLNGLWAGEARDHLPDAFGEILGPQLQHRIGQRALGAPDLPTPPRPNPNRAKQKAQRAARKRSRKEG